MGEAARRPGCPEPPLTPLELMTPRPGEGFSNFEKLVWPVAGVIGGLIASSLRNVVLKRPFWAGLPIHVLSGGTGYLVCSKVGEVKRASKAEDDAIIKHYISLHPEDFPPFERKRYRDVYTRFDPVR